MERDRLETLAKDVIDSAFHIHATFGPGLLESAYTACLVFELASRGLDVRTEVPVPVVYKGRKMADVGYKMDILVENELILEIKSVESVAPVHLSQLVSYLKLANRRLGFLFNFNVPLFKQGIYRRVNGL